MKELSIMLPAYGITRYYVMSFMHHVDFHNAEIYVTEGNVRIISKRYPVHELMADTFQKVADVLREYVGKGEKKRVDVPASGNDKKIFTRLRKDLHLSSESSFMDIFDSYVKHLRKIDDHEFDNEIRASARKYSAPSIFRPELYSFTRGPFLDGKLDSDEVGYESERYTLGEFLIRLGGYIVSRVGVVIVPGLGGKPRYLTTLTLPAEVHKITDMDFHTRLDILRKERLLGFHPEEALIMWLSLSLPEDSPDVFMIGMEGPSGQAAARISAGVYVPLRSYGERARKFLEEVRRRRRIKALKYFIKSAIEDRSSTIPVSLLRLLFLASQQDARAADELSLRASKIVLGYASVPMAAKPTYAKIAEGILRNALPALQH